MDPCSYIREVFNQLMNKLKSNWRILSRNGICLKVYPGAMWKMDDWG